MTEVAYEIHRPFYSWKCPVCEYYPNEVDPNFSDVNKPVECEHCGKKVMLKND